VRKRRRDCAGSRMAEGALARAQTHQLATSNGTSANGSMRASRSSP
jgi:hypothetical protein